jgi:hypothetical protein
MADDMTHIEPRRSDPMRISKMLGATMVAGAIASGGPAGAAATPPSSTSTATGTASGDSSVPVTSSSPAATKQ